MARDTGDLLLEGNARAVVVEVDESRIDDFTAVMAEGWGMDPAPLDRCHRDLIRRAPRLHRLYLGLVDGRPAGVAAYAALERSAYLLGAVVLPAFRGVGLYKTLVQERLRDARRRGLSLATTQARLETSAPILERLGFESVCALTSYAG
jgi:GNAT superfamily N-acetyltransferase